MFCRRIIHDLGFGHQTEEISQRLIKALLEQTEENVQRLIKKIQSNQLRKQFTKLAKKIQSFKQEIKNSLIIRRLQVQKVTQYLNQTKRQLLQKSNKVIQTQEKQRRQRQRAVSGQKRCEEFQRHVAEYQQKNIKAEKQCEEFQRQVAEYKRKDTETQERCKQYQPQAYNRYGMSLRKLQKKIVRMEERIADLNTRTKRLSIFQPLLKNPLMANAKSLQEEFQSITISINDSDPAECIQYFIVIKKKPKSVVIAQALVDIKEEKKIKSHVI